MLLAVCAHGSSRYFFDRYAGLPAGVLNQCAQFEKTDSPKINPSGSGPHVRSGFNLVSLGVPGFELQNSIFKQYHVLSKPRPRGCLRPSIGQTVRAPRSGCLVADSLGHAATGSAAIRDAPWRPGLFWEAQRVPTQPLETVKDMCSQCEGPGPLGPLYNRGASKAKHFHWVRSLERVWKPEVF